MSACLLSLAVVSLLLPVSLDHFPGHSTAPSSPPKIKNVADPSSQTAFHASFNNTSTADRVVIKVSRGTSVVSSLLSVA
jgi:hypothetical protein